MSLEDTLASVFGTVRDVLRAEDPMNALEQLAGKACGDELAPAPSTLPPSADDTAPHSAPPALAALDGGARVIRGPFGQGAKVT